MATIDTIREYFANILQRSGEEVTEEEINSYVSAVDSGVLTLAQVRLTMINSPEGRDVQDVVRLYQTVFGRVPDKQGLNDQVDTLRGPATEADLANSFANSPEFISRFGGNTVNPAFINAVYQQVLGRTPSTGEVQFYLESGFSAGRIALAFSESPEFQAAVSGAVTTFLDNAGQGTATYTGPLGGSFNVGEAITLTDRIDAPGIDESQAGSGVDTTGTEGDDRYIANSETLNPGDEINGMGGEDTVELSLGGQGLLADFEDSLDSQNVETVQVTANLGLIGLLTQGITLDMLEALGVETVINVSSTAPLLLDNVQNMVDLEIRNVSQISAFGSTQPFNYFIVNYDDDALGSDAAVQNIALEDSLVELELNADGVDAIGTLNFAVEGDNVVILGDNSGPSNELMPTVINVTGDGFLALTDQFGFFGDSDDDELEDVVTVDASENTGGVLVDLRSNTADVTFTGGAGMDGVLFGEGEFDENDVVDGAAGSDYLGIDADDVDELETADVSNTENLILHGTLSTTVTVEDFDQLDFETVALAFNGTGSVTFDDADDVEFFLVGDSIEGAAFGDQTAYFNGTLAFEDTDDLVVTVGFDAEGAPGEGFNRLADAVGIDNSGSFFYDLNRIDVTEVETIDLTLNGDLEVDYAANTAAVNELETFTIRGAGDFILNNGDDNFAGTTFELTELTGGFSNQGLPINGSQEYVLGALGSAATAFVNPNEAGVAAEFIGYDFDSTLPGGDVTNDPGSVINLGGDDDDEDIVTFTSADFGNIAIEGFELPDVVDSTDDVLDLSAFISNPDAQITLTDNGANLIISSDDFAGNILLVGITFSDLTTAYGAGNEESIFGV